MEVSKFIDLEAVEVNGSDSSGYEDSDAGQSYFNWGVDLIHHSVRRIYCARYRNRRRMGQFSQATD